MWKKILFLVLMQMSTFLNTLWCYEFTEQQVIDYHVGTSGGVEDIESLVADGFFNGVESILDVGCGDGQVTARLAKQFPQISFIGCDISKAMLEFASKKYPPSEYPNLTFVEKDACKLGYKNQFDRVVSFSSLHWIKDQKLALQSIYHALKPQGKALIRATPKSSNNDFKTISLKVILSFKWVSSFINFKSTHSFHSERDYRKILNGIGFTIDRIEQKNRELVFADRSALTPFLRAILTPLAHLPPAKRDSFLNDYYNALVEYGSVNEQGEIRFHFDKVELAISKP